MIIGYYNKQQRLGVLTLLLVIGIVVGIYKLFNHTIQKQRSSLPIPTLKSEPQKELPSYTYNPNYIHDDLGYMLGLTIQEIDCLLEYRSQGKWMNSLVDFQRVTQVSNQKLIELQKKFYFPKFTSFQKKPKKRFKKKQIASVQLIKLNKASAEEFQKIRGIGEKLSQRIVKYRRKLGGFYVVDQLDEVWGIPKEVCQRLKKQVVIEQIPKLKRININTATKYQLAKIVYIDYKLAQKIIDFRIQEAEIVNLQELKQIQGFPLEKYNRIILYLRVD